MKAKLLAKRLRTRSDEFHRMALSFSSDDTVASYRARLLGDLLQEVADQVSPPKKPKPTNGVKKAKKS
jgi:hypothetical protein